MELIEDKKIPEFAILQNSRTKVSGVWTKARGEWVQAPASDYEILGLLSKLIRASDDPLEALKVIAKNNPDLLDE